MFLEYYKSHREIHTVDLFKFFRIPPIKIIGCIRSAALIYCLKNHLLRNSIDFMQVGQIHSHDTRSRSNLVELESIILGMAFFHMNMKYLSTMPYLKMF
jgi:hypothetical protein